MNTAVLDQGQGDAEAPARVLDMQRLAYHRDGPPPLLQRLAALKALDGMLRAHAEPMAAAISADFGNRAHQETIVAELVPSLGAIRNARRNLRRWAKPERRHVDISFQPGSAWVEWQPLGCVAIVSPWNYPLLLTVSPLVDAIAAGNRVIVKPSELVPRFSALFARMIADAIDPATVTVLTGGPDVARAVCALPLDHLLFTGSTAIGRLVARAAAETLTPVTLELGGKSPAILCRGYDVGGGGASTVALGKFFNAGQTCIAPDYALVPQEQVDGIRQAAVMDAAGRMYPTVSRQPGLHQHRVRPPPRPAARPAARGRGRAARGCCALQDDAYAERRIGAHRGAGPAARRHADAGGDLRPDPPRDRLSAKSWTRPSKLRQRAPASRWRCIPSPRTRRSSPPCHGPHRVRRRVGEQRADALHPGRPAVRRRRALPAWAPTTGATGSAGSRTRAATYKAGRFSGFEFLAPPYGRKMRVALKAMLMR